jgi:hypothetical protein
MFHLGEKVRCIMSPRAISLLCIGLALSSWLMSCASQPQIERQTMVHQMGSNVMPFDLAKTQHVFEMTERGGIQQVVTRGANSGD